MEPHGQALDPQQPYPPTPLGAEALRCASAKASVGHPPVSEIRRSIIDVVLSCSQRVLRIPPRPRQCLHAEVRAFVETLRAVRRCGTQAWSPA